MPASRKDARPIAVLGIGRFGARIAKHLTRAGEEVIACDLDRDTVELIAPDVAQAVALDVTDEHSLRARGVHRVKAAVIGIGEDFEATVLCTMILKQMEVPRIVARARSRTTAEVLRRVGAHDVVLAEDEAADRWANRLLGPQVLNQIEFHEGYSIVEFKVPEVWADQTLAQLDVRRKHGLHVVAVIRPDPGSPGATRVEIPGPNEPLTHEEIIIVMGRDEDIRSLAGL